MKTYYVYILSNKSHSVLYVGMTNNLERRLYEHKQKLVKGFSSKYNCTKLVYFESSTNVNAIIAREKEIKKWRREKINELIKGLNSDWNDLSEEFEV